MNLLLGILLLATLAVAKRPNILFILTDDQGKYVGGLEEMPKLQVSSDTKRHTNSVSNT